MVARQDTETLLNGNIGIKSEINAFSHLRAPTHGFRRLSTAYAIPAHRTFM